MRVMVIVKATQDSEAGKMPDKQLLTDMGKYNEELVKAGVMLAGEGLQASSKGKRVHFSGSKRTVTDGPFTETKELIAGFWLWRSARCLSQRISGPRCHRSKRNKRPNGGCKVRRNSERIVPGSL